jgi:hypothetical protein
MPRYPSGQPFTLATTIRDMATQALVDPTALTLTWALALPGSTATVKHWPSPAEIVRDSLGTFHFDVPAGLTAGRYRYWWQPTGTGAGQIVDVFDVEDPTETYPIVSLDDAKTDIGKTSTVNDAGLRTIIASTTAVVEQRVGPVMPRSFVDIITHPAPRICLHHTPVISLTSLAAIYTGGQVDPLTALDFDPVTGVVWRPDRWRISGGQRITYVAGRLVVPAHFTEAALIIIGHLWETQYGGPTSPARILGAEEVTVLPGWGFGVPNRALELLAPDAVMPPVA